MKSVRWILVSVFALSGVCFGKTIDLGFISFDTLIPGAAGAPGVVVFSINNFTGNPLNGGFALPPDFPAISSLIFQSSMLSMSDANTTQSFLLGDLAPGSFTPTNLEFPDTARFTSATFSAILNLTTISLSNGTTFQAGSRLFSTAITPSSGPFLVPGVDSALIGIADVPEPATVYLVVLAPPVLFLMQRRHASKRKPNSSSV